MPTPSDLQSVVATLQAESRSDALRIDRDVFVRKAAALHRLAVLYVTNVLSEWHLYREAGERHDATQIMESGQIAPRHRKLLHRWLNLLCNERLLRADGEVFVAAVPLRSESPNPLVEAALEQWPEAPELVLCLKACGENLESILRDKKSALEFLFPGGAFHVAEAIYERSAPWRYCNDLLGRAMAAIADRWTDERPLRILEIGAGVGGTTASLLPVLRHANVEFVFTDVSKLFLLKAGKKFADYPFIKRQILDLEQELEPQGAAAGTFDVIVASNVLHATSDIRLTMRRVRSLLRPGGRLLLIELTENQTWLDLIFALLEGWAKYSDDIRTDHPTLSIPEWQALAAATGFPSVHHFPEDRADAHAISNTVFIMEAVEA